MLNSLEVFDIISHCLENKEPISLVRCGDGESYLLEGKNIADIKKVIFNHNGVEPDEKTIEEIRNNLIYTFENADIIGIPNEKYKNSRNKYWREGLKILTENVKLKERQAFCSMDINHEWLENGLIHKLLNSRHNISYISSHNLSEYFKVIYKINRIEHYIIPPERKYFPEYAGIPHYPDAFYKAKKWIDSFDCSGKLCLVGAGVIGKIYCQWFKERGGIAIDIGSVMDKWAGIETRNKISIKNT